MAPPADDLARRQHLDRYLHTAAQCLASSGFKVSVRLSTETPEDAILHASAEEQVDLIVMATHGRSGLARLLLGSVAAQLVHRASTPILLVRPAAHTLTASSTHQNN